ncbi:hypothetical protein [Gemmobacter megaterium]|nr:hypothetical protein [Gemmobacter megaterium]
MIKDKATKQVLAHMQQTSGFQQMLYNVVGLGSSSSPFSPLGIASLIQNEQIKHGISELQNSMVLMQNLQYGTLALSGLGIGISVAGFAATIAKLNAIEKRLESLSNEIAQVTNERRNDELKGVFAELGADLQNVETLVSRRDPQRVAEQLQLSLSRAARRIEAHFLRECDFTELKSISLERLDRLWTLAAAIRLCQDSSMQALISGNDLKVAEQIGRGEIDRQIGMMRVLSPDTLSRLVSRSERDTTKARELRIIALEQSRVLRDGIKGGVLALAGQISIAETLRREGMSGTAYMRQIMEPTDEPLLCLVPAAAAS